MLSNLQEDILKALERKWKEYPDMRFGQLVTNVLSIGEDPFYISDKISIEVISSYPSPMWHGKNTERK